MNHCRTTEAAFEREFRKGLDVLITVPELKIGIAAPVRVSQLCNHVNKMNCSLLGGSCGNLWSATLGFRDTGLCGSITKDCSDEQRLQDGYETAKAYRDIMAASLRSMPPCLRGKLPLKWKSAVSQLGGKSKQPEPPSASVTLLGYTSLRANRFRAVTVSTRRFSARMQPPKSCLTALLVVQRMCVARTPETRYPTHCVRPKIPGGTFHPGLF